MTAWEEHRNDILGRLRRNALDDGDIRSVADDLTGRFAELLDACDIKGDGQATEAELEHTRVLVDHFVLYKVGVDLRMGGSRCDYSAYAATKAVEGYALRLDGSEKASRILDEIRKNIAKFEWEPEFAIKAEERVGLIPRAVA